MSSTNKLGIVQLPAGPIETNCFLVIDPASAEALVIDAPPDVLDALDREIAARKVRPVALVLTHTHWDHIGDAADVAEKYSIPILVHDLDQGRLDNPQGGDKPIRPAKADRLLAEGDEVRLGSRTFAVIHTPGHSPGQISLYSEPDGVMFGGDTLFPNGHGALGFPGTSEEQTIATMARLLDLPDDVTVYPGHGAETQIGNERRWMTRLVETGQTL